MSLAVYPLDMRDMMSVIIICALSLARARAQSIFPGDDVNGAA